MRIKLMKLKKLMSFFNIDIEEAKKVKKSGIEPKLPDPEVEQINVDEKEIKYELNDKEEDE